MKVIILGAGLVGGPMARDLARDGEFEVAVADISSRNLAKLDDAPEIIKVRADLSDCEKVKSIVAGADYVINATPGFMGHSVLRSVIEAGIDVSRYRLLPRGPLRPRRARPRARRYRDRRLRGSAGDEQRSRIVRRRHAR